MGRAKVKSRAKTHLVSARFAPSSTIKLTFGDASFSLPIKRLEIPPDRIQWKTVTASPAGDALSVRAAKGELIKIDSATLRYLVEERYAAKVDAALKSSQFTREELKALAGENPPLPQSLSEPGRDLRCESWK